MPIDTSMYQMARLPDFVGSYREGKDWRQKQDVYDKQQQVAEAKKGLYSMGPDGKLSINQEGMQKLASVDPDSGYQAQRQFSQDQQADAKSSYEAKLRDTDMLSRGLSGANPQNWGDVRSSLISQGLASEETLPVHFDQNYIRAAHGKTLSYKDQIELKLKEAALGARARAVTDKKNKVSPSQAKQMGLYQQGLKAEEQYKKATSGKGFDAYDDSSSFQWIDKNDWAPNFLKSDESIAAETAKSRWVEAYLRDASGAAIPPSERGAYAKDFFPVAGDSKQTIKDKTEARRIKMESAKFASGQNVDFSRGEDVDKLADADIDALYTQHGGE